MKKAIPIKILVVFYLFYKALTATDIIKEAVFSGILRCVNIIIPSLFFMMVISGILIRSMILQRISPVFDKFSRFVFGMDGTVFIIFLLSMFAGYPVGASLITEHYRNGRISAKQAEIYLCVCYGAGPAFIYGVVSGSLWGSRAGNLVILSNVIANIFSALILRVIFSKKLKPSASSGSKARVRLDCADFMTSISSASESLFSLSAMIITFSVISALIKSGDLYKHLVRSEFAEEIVSSVMDITAVADFNIYSYHILPVISGLISFGGICVIMQIYSVTEYKFNMFLFIIVRVSAGLLSYFSAALLAEYFFADEKTAYTLSQAGQPYATESPASAIMLIFMMFITLVGYSDLSRYDKKNEKK